MPFILSGARKGGRILAAAVALLAIGAAPAAAGTVTIKNAAVNPDGCVADHQLSRPFSAWGDFNDYALSPGGDFESGAAGWWLPGAAVTAGNQPFTIGTTGKTSLRIPAGASAVSAPMCIDSTFPHFRVFARNLGTLKSTLRAEVLFLNSKGEIKATASGQILAGSTAWFPSDSLKIGVVFNSALAGGAAPVAFRFTAPKDAAWQIDDLYVDPYMRR
jgi:hypothetical protein